MSFLNICAVFGTYIRPVKKCDIFSKLKMYKKFYIKFIYLKRDKVIKEYILFLSR